MTICEGRTNIEIESFALFVKCFYIINYCFFKWLLVLLFLFYLTFIYTGNLIETRGLVLRETCFRQHTKL